MHVGESANKKNVLEELLELGMVLVALDARVDGVDVPGHLGRDPQLRLNLSFRFGLPMALDAWGIRATLTFGGVPYACRFPWQSIYLLVSHVNGDPYLFPDEVPAELLAQVGVESAWSIQPSAKPKPAPRPKFRLVPTPVDDADEPEGADADADADAEAEDPGEADATPAAAAPRGGAEGPGRRRKPRRHERDANAEATAADAGEASTDAHDDAAVTHKLPQPQRAPRRARPSLAAEADAEGGDDAKGAADADASAPPTAEAASRPAAPDDDKARRRGHLRVIK